MSKKKWLTTLSKKLLLGTLGLGLFGGSLLINEVKTLGATLDKVEVINANSFAPAKYNVVASFNKNTKVETFGSNDWKLLSNSNLTAWTINHPADSLKGKIGVYYRNVGLNNGRVISLKITVEDWNKYNTVNTEKISYGHFGINHSQSGYNWIKQKWTYIYEDTGKEATDISGIYMNVVDIDAHQYMEFDNSSVNKMEKIFVTKDSWIDISKKSNGNYKFAESKGNSSENTDKFAMFTYLYNGSSISFHWGIDYAGRGTIKDNQYNPTEPGYEFFAYNGQKLVPSETLVPQKFISDSDEKLKSDITLIDSQESFSYRLQAQVSQESSDFYYSSWAMTDSLAKELDVDLTKIKVVNEVGTDVTSYFNNESKGNELKLVAKADTLKSAKFYGHFYTVDLNVKINKEADISKYVTSGIDNIVTVTIGGKSASSKKVNTKWKEPVISQPKKEVTNSEGQSINNEGVFAGDTLIYNVSQQVNQKGKDITTAYSRFVLKDKLDDKVAFEKAVLLKDGKELSDVKGITYDEKLHTVTFTADNDFLNAMELKGETYTLQIKTKVIKEIAEGQEIKNKGQSLVNKSEQNTNEVVNPIKVLKGSIEVTKVTNQVVGVVTNANEESKEDDSKQPKLARTGSFVAEDDLKDSPLNYEKLPQKDVTYEVIAFEDIEFGNGDLISEAGQSFGKMTTNEEGKASISDLYSGKYALQEVSAPVGIQVDPDPIIVDLVAGEDSKVLEVKTSHVDPLQKVNLKGTKLFEQEKGDFVAGEGATFGLFTGEDYVINDKEILKKDTMISSFEVDKEGNFSYEGILVPDLLYYVQELDTKEGYQLRNDLMYFVYEPKTNNAVHDITLFDEGYVSNDDYVLYTSLIPKESVEQEQENETSSTESTGTSESKEVEKTTETTDKQEEEKEKPVEIEKLEGIKNWLIKANNIEKSILTADGSLVTDYQLLSEQEKVTFVGMITIGDNKKGTTLELVDNLPEGFLYDSFSLLDEKGKDVSNQLTVKEEGQKITFSFKQEYADSLKRTKLALNLVTVYNHKKEFAGKTFENVMDLLVDGKKLTSEKVTLTPPIEKEVVLPQTGTDNTRLMGYTLVILGVVSAGLYLIKFRKPKLD